MSIFVSYSESDRELVQSLVEKIEVAGKVSCWYFNRDTRDGKSYLETIQTQIAQSKQVVLIVSKESLLSKEVDSEVGFAHQAKIPILPIFLDLGIDDVRRAENGWLLAFGRNAGINISKNDDVHALKQVAFRVRAAVPEIQESQHVLTQKWVTDGSQIEPSIAHKVIFRSGQVADFIEGDQYRFVSANKGCGKTLLLQCKRAAMQKNSIASRSECGVQYIPANNPYLDTLGSDLPTLTKPQLKYLAEIRNSRRIWSFAIRASAVSYFQEEAGKFLDQDEFEKNCGVKLDSFLPANSNPTVVFKSLLALPHKALNKLLDRQDSNLDYAFRQIHSGVAMFIDRVDQALAEIKTERRLSKDVWINVQAGLVEAAWDLRASNNHVKVFASIREEAFASYESDSRANLVSAVLQLRYRPDDLQGMLDHLVGLYEGREGLQEFVGLISVRNTPARTSEEIFEYVLRHTRGRPRDVVTICKSLSDELVLGNETQFRDIVNRVSSNEIVRLVFKEMKVFLDCLKTIESRKKLFSLIPYNILTRHDLTSIATQFNHLSGITTAEFESDDEGMNFHPFCELYNCGLLGFVDGDNVYDEGRFRFKKPWDVLSVGHRCLPNAKFYVLHPSLHHIIKQARPNPGYHALRYIPVGDGMRWRYYFPTLSRILVHCIDCGFCETEIDEKLSAFLEACLCNNSDDAEVENETRKEKLEQFMLVTVGDHDDLVVLVKDMMECLAEHDRRIPVRG